MHCGVAVAAWGDPVPVKPAPQLPPVTPAGLDPLNPVMLPSVEVSAALRSAAGHFVAAQVGDPVTVPCLLSAVVCWHVSVGLLTAKPGLHFILQVPFSCFVVLQSSTIRFPVTFAATLALQSIGLHTPGVSLPFKHDDAVHL